VALLLADIINSMIQAIIFSYSVEYCIRDKNQIKKMKLILLTIIFFIISSSFTSIFGNFSICVFITHIACLMAIVLLYKNNRLKALIPYTLVYCFISSTAIISSNLFFGIVREAIPKDYMDIAQILAIYAPQFLLAYLFIRFMDKFIQLYKLIVMEKINIIVIIIISFCLDFVVTSFLIIYNDEDKLFKNIIITILCAFLAFVISYFGKIKKKSDQIFKLNEVLEVKNNELRKIKHDYGAQISYLYGLCLMDRYDDLKQSLKNIINNNEAMPTAVEVNGNEGSMLSLALKPAIDRGIHVIVEEESNSSLIDIDEMELYRVVSNIVNNAIKAMNAKGIIVAKCYEYLDNAIIRIKNNGPKIPEQNLNDIFKAGFTTKDNSNKNHGYGLSIVKDLVESNNGKISVKSTDESTEFKIVLPIKKIK
jgi:two-component system sensor histidine kinase AgrC